MSAQDIYNNTFREYPDVLSVPQVSTILGVSSKTVYRILSDGALKSLKVGREFKIPKLYLLQYIKILALTN
jgi:excisionase family DNA binding protein